MDAKKEFLHGCNDCTETQQLIAFWTHAIDTFSSVLEHDINIYNEDIKKFGTFDLCGTTTMYAYMGAVRGGLYRSIEALPTEVRLPVKEYFKRRVQRTSEIVPEDVLEIDLLLGEPF